jgi:methanogenic corrinoid protein MtbC1
MAKGSGDPLIDSRAFARAKGLFASPSARLPTEAVQALASEVIARLSQGRERGVAPAVAAPEPRAWPDFGDRISRLSHALLALDDREATEIVMEAHAEGAHVEALYLGLLAEAARRLGQWWEDDRIGAVEVVIGAGRIYAIMRGLRRLFGPGPERGAGFRALFSTVPGETHMLGVAMAADLLTLHGWRIDLRGGLDHETLLAEFGRGQYPIVGLSASSTRMLFPLARLIVALRVSNPGVWVLVSGPIAELEPEVASLVDADASARSFAEAEKLLEGRIAGAQPRGRR